MPAVCTVLCRVTKQRNWILPLGIYNLNFVRQKGRSTHRKDEYEQELNKIYLGLSTSGDKKLVSKRLFLRKGVARSENYTSEQMHLISHINFTYMTNQ